MKDMKQFSCRIRTKKEPVKGVSVPSTDTARVDPAVILKVRKCHTYVFLLVNAVSALWSHYMTYAHHFILTPLNEVIDQSRVHHSFASSVAGEAVCSTGTGTVSDSSTKLLSLYDVRELYERSSHDLVSLMCVCQAEIRHLIDCVFECVSVLRGLQTRHEHRMRRLDKDLTTPKSTKSVTNNSSSGSGRGNVNEPMNDDGGMDVSSCYSNDMLLQSLKQAGEALLAVVERVRELKRQNMLGEGGELGRQLDMIESLDLMLSELKLPVAATTIVTDWRDCKLPRNI